MIYTQEITWKAISEFVPHAMTIKSLDGGYSIDKALRDAAVSYFLLDCPRYYWAAHIIRTALLEIQEIGWITFGNKEEL